MRKVMAVVMLTLVAGSVSGCIIESPGPWGWRHHHHYDRY